MRRLLSKSRVFSLDAKVSKIEAGEALQVILAVLSAFFGIRSKRDHDKGAPALKPAQVIIVAIVAVICLVLLLIALAGFIAGK